MGGVINFPEIGVTAPQSARLSWVVIIASRRCGTALAPGIPSAHSPPHLPGGAGVGQGQPEVGEVLPPTATLPGGHGVRSRVRFVGAWQVMQAGGQSVVGGEGASKALELPLNGVQSRVLRWGRGCTQHTPQRRHPGQEKGPGAW